MSNRVTLSGNPPEQEEIGAPAPINPETGQHRDYWVLSKEERSKGFIRPVRMAYIHECGVETLMSIPIAETYARDPKFYGSTFCCGCNDHYPVPEFKWTDTEELVGS